MSSNYVHAKPRELVQSRIASYLKSSWYCRWIIILIVTASYFFIPALHRKIVLVLLPVAALYNLLLLAGSKRDWAVITNQWLMILVDSLMALALVIYTGGISSPYLLLPLVTIGLYTAWLTGSERSERDKLIALGTETEKERQQLLALINNMRDAVIVVDNDERIVIYNQAAAALAGSSGDLHQKSINDAVQFLNAEGRLAELKMDRDTPQERKDLQAKAPDGSLVNISVSTAPYIVDRQNHGHVVIIRDISQEKTIDKEREEFIAVASHELRTPLTIAQGNVSFLLSPSYLPQNPEAVAMLNSALRSLQQLSHIISDLTNLSKVESEELDVQLEPLNPVALLHEFESDYRDQAKSKGLQLQIKIDSHLSSATILTSRYVVREILSIYISNAIKFTDKGVVNLGVMNPTDKSAGVTFSVTDTGVGISQSDQKKLFEKFFQSEEYTTRVHGGTGLGLYIARSLATRITARVWFETELGKGSTFYLWVPPYSQHKQDRGKVAAAETKDFFNTV